MISAWEILTAISRSRDKLVLSGLLPAAAGRTWETLAAAGRNRGELLLSWPQPAAAVTNWYCLGRYWPRL